MLTTQPILNSYQEWLASYLRHVPEIEHAILSSTDGFCLAQTALPKDILGRLAALSSSLFAVSTSLSKHMDGSVLDHIQLHTEVGCLILIQHESAHQMKVILLVKLNQNGSIENLLKNTTLFFAAHPIVSA